MLRLQVGLLSFFLCQVVNIDINMDVYICCFSHFFFSYNIYGIFPWEYPFNITLNMLAEQNDFLWNVLLSFWWFVNDIEEEVLNENDLGGDCFVLFGVFFFSSFGSVIVNSLLLLSLLGVTPKMILEMVYNLEGWLFTIPICQRILGQDAEPWVTSIRSLTLWMSY